jgi:hypothetical protein
MEQIRNILDTKNGKTMNNIFMNHCPLDGFPEASNHDGMLNTLVHKNGNGRSNSPITRGGCPLLGFFLLANETIDSVNSPTLT